MYVGEDKQYEADPSQDYEAIKADVRRVFEMAIAWWYILWNIILDNGTQDIL